MSLEYSAGAIIFRKQEGKKLYLLLHYQSGHWEFPKGHIEKGEKEIETVKRETEEETGIKDIIFIKGFKESIKYFFTVKKKTISKTVIFYLAETKTEKINLSEEHIGFKWLDYKEAKKQLTFKNAQKIIEKADNLLSEKGF
ncbi:MAG: bis(5'-nucleosyl)-tetraphosphatase [Candidatus Nealsonbacteria bacterium]|nr:bis(5'-nucleosyl)-tetraphosphatase [Candidatus Nealsonbacteria bacterium]